MLRSDLHADGGRRCRRARSRGSGRDRIACRCSYCSVDAFRAGWDGCCAGVYREGTSGGIC